MKECRYAITRTCPKKVACAGLRRPQVIKIDAERKECTSKYKIHPRKKFDFLESFLELPVTQKY